MRRSEGLPPEIERFDAAALADLPSGLSLSRLPGGRHGMPRALIEQSQRLRIVSAMLAALERQGYQRVTLSDLTREAGVSRTAFYSQFGGKEECFLATYDLVTDWLCERIGAAMTAQEGWEDRVLGGVSMALDLLAANPPVAHMLAVDVFQAGPAARRRQLDRLSQLAVALRAGRPGERTLPQELEELLIGGAISVIGRYVDEGRTGQLPDAAEDLIAFLVTPSVAASVSRPSGAQRAA